MEAVLHLEVTAESMTSSSRRDLFVAVVLNRWLDEHKDPDLLRECINQFVWTTTSTYAAIESWAKDSRFDLAPLRTPHVPTTPLTTIVESKVRVVSEDSGKKTRSILETGSRSKRVKALETLSRESVTPPKGEGPADIFGEEKQRLPSDRRRDGPERKQEGKLPPVDKRARQTKA